MRPHKDGAWMFMAALCVITPNWNNLSVYQLMRDKPEVVGLPIQKNTIHPQKRNRLLIYTPRERSLKDIAAWEKQDVEDYILYDNDVYEMSRGRNYL